MLNKWLFQQIDNSALVLFRIMFGFLLAVEAFGAIATGWVRRVLMEPEFTFNFIGFEFLQPLPGNGMLYYYAVMGVFGLWVMLGFKYKFSIAAYTIMWAGVYLMQKTSYNNHYYLLMLVCFMMFWFPAHRYASVDAWLKPSIKKIHMSRWVWLTIILQLWIVYTYASVAKFYPDWLDTSFPEILMKSKKDIWLIGEFLQQEWVFYAVMVYGLFFDLLIVPLLLWKKTRIFAFIAAVFFHLFNSFVFHIGIFPYLALAFTVFFFPTKKVHHLFLRNKPYYDQNKIIVPNYKNLLISCLAVWFIIQVSLPLRHWFFKDDVLWTEEGHRLSWRMMLRTKSGISTFRIIDKATGKISYVNKSEYLTDKQLRTISTKPDAIWQFAQYLEKEYKKQGKDIEVYVNTRVSVNGGPFKQLIDPKVDLAAEEWKHFSHHEWILPSSSEE